MINRDKPFVFGKLFFIDHQSKILKLANSWIGRKILCIDGKKSDVGKNEIIKVEPNAITWREDKEYKTEFRTHNKFSKRIYHAFKPLWYLFHAWDTLLANNLEPAWNLGFDTLTVYPDADTETSTVDGRVAQSGGTSDSWSSRRSGAGNYFEDNTSPANAPLAQAHTTTNNWQFLSRGIFLFDTSSLPDGSTISSATFSNYVTTRQTTSNVGVNVVSSTPASNTALVNGDYTQTGSTKFSTVIRVNDMSTNAYADFALNASGLTNISKTGISKFGTRLEEDLDNSSPTWSSNALMGTQISFAEHTGTTQDPKLVVIYTTESASPSLSPSLSPSASVSPSPSASASPSSSPSLSPSSSISPSPSSSASPSSSPSLSPSSSVSPSPSASASPSSSVSLSPSASISPSPSASASPSSSVSLSPSLSPSLSGSPSQSESRSQSRSPSASPSPSSSESPSPSPSPSPSSSESLSPSPSASESPSPSATDSPSPSVTPSASPSLSPSASNSPSPSTSISASISPSQEPGTGLYSKEALANLPTDSEDLAIIYGAEDEVDVSTDNAVRVPQAGSTNYIAHQFKKENNTNRDSLKVLVNLQSTLAPSAVPLYLQVWNNNSGAWETIDTDNASNANTDLDLTATITSNVAYYYDSDYIVAFRVQQYINGVAHTVSVDLVDICFIIVYADKYSDQSTTYTDKYSDQATEYTDKYTVKRC